jgi:hypothetical protein
VADPLGVAADEVGRIHAADQQVTGVDAPRYVGVLERPLDVSGRLDDRAGVRMQHELEALC